MLATLVLGALVRHNRKRTLRSLRYNEKEYNYLVEVVYI